VTLPAVGDYTPWQYSTFTHTNGSKPIDVGTGT